MTQPTPAKIIIAGSRGLKLNPVEISIALQCMMSNHNLLLQEVVCGGCPGPDMDGLRWATRSAAKAKIFEAKWHLYGKAAGPIRNQEMANYADALLCFYNGTSPGTKNMIDLMNKLGKPVHIVTRTKDQNL